MLNRLPTWLLRAFIKYKSRSRFPRREGHERISGLTDQVEIRRDKQGVPYIYAQNRKDLFFAQGYVHAQDRLWQMDMARMICCGRLAERFGKGALETDRLTRTLGFYRMAEKDLELAEKPLLNIIQSYCDGVNAFLEDESTRSPVEFALLKYEPAPFTPREVMALTRLMALTLANGWGHELARARLFEILGPELAREFDLSHAPDDPPHLPYGPEHNRRTPDGRLEALQGPFLRQQGGSNAWVLDGRHTASGSPILANDPHLSPAAPSFWYQIYLECPNFRVQGVSLPGVPLVMVGHNAHIAWGITMAFTDLQDVFIEEFADDHLYYQGDRLREAEIVEEKIIVKDGIDHIEKVVITRNGPVISDVVEVPESKKEFRYTLKSPALKASKATQGWYKLNVARNWDDFVHALQWIESPGLNIVYADTQQNIGYWVTGHSPIRKQGKGEFPQKGRDGAHDWIGRVPRDEMPHAINPRDGKVISANHKIVGDEYPYFLGDIWMNGYRARRIGQLLEQRDDWTVKDMGNMQMDLYCWPGMHFATYYEELKFEEGELERVRQEWLHWDGYLTKTSVAGTIYEYTRKSLSRLLLDTVSQKADAYERFVGRGCQPTMFRVCEFQGKDVNALFTLLNRDDSPVWSHVGGREAALRKALKMAVQDMKADLGRKMSDWQWGKIHQVSFKHAVAVNEALAPIFNVGPFPIGGDTDTVCQTSMQPERGYSADLALPSYRQVIDLANFDKSRWVLPPGNSGHLGGPHHRDQIEAWLEGELYPMPWSRPEIETHTPFTLILAPES